MKSASSNKELKKKVGIAAADLVKDGMIIGIGTGSTVAFLIEELGKRINEGLRIQGVTTSYQTRILCKQAGIPVLDTGMVNRIDLAIDGADEIDDSLNAIKGGGAAHTIEKIIAAMSDEFVLIGDESKLVKELGVGFPVPIEVIPSALEFVKRKLKELNADPKLRIAVKKDGPVITDNGNFVLDLFFSQAPDIYKVNNSLICLPGVIETGLFLGMAKKALIAQKGQVVTLIKTSSEK